MIYIMLVLIGFSIRWDLGLALVGLVIIEYILWIRKMEVVKRIAGQLNYDFEKLREELNSSKGEK